MGGRIIVITGTPGVGKSSVSSLLASRIDSRLVSLGELARREGLYVGYDRKRDTLVADTTKLSERVEEIAAGSEKDVIVEGHYATSVVSPQRTHLVFVLRRDPQELVGILEGRGYKEKKVRENVAAEILDVCLYDAVCRLGASKVCEVDVTGRRADEVVEEIVQILSERKRCRVGLVDWLGKLEAEGKLDEYLKDF